MLVVEDVIGRCAPLVGLDAREVRRRSFYVDGQETPYGQPVRHAERLTAAWQQLHDEADVERRLEEVAAFNAAHPHTKRALALTPVKFGISFNFTAFNQGGALVHVYKDGSVLVNHGGTEMGQGLHTKMLQVAATALGVPLELVRLAPTRTDKVPNTSATAASAGADLNGGAVKHACEQILRRLARSTPAAACRGATWSGGLLRAGPALGGRLLPHRGAPLGLDRDARPPLQVLRLRRLCRRGRGRRLHRCPPHPARRHRPRRRGLALAAGRPRPGRGRLRPGRGVADPGGPPLGRPPRRPQRGRLATQAASTYKLPSFSEMPGDFRVSLLQHAHEDGAVYGSKAVGRAARDARVRGPRGVAAAAAAFAPDGAAPRSTSRRQRRPRRCSGPSRTPGPAIDRAAWSVGPGRAGPAGPEQPRCPDSSRSARPAPGAGSAGAESAVEA